MRNVNIIEHIIIILIVFRFILTMRNVNTEEIKNTITYKLCFILTMRNVNEQVERQKSQDEFVLY